MKKSWIMCVAVFGLVVSTLLVPTRLAFAQGDEHSTAIREYLRVSGSEQQYGVLLNFMVEGVMTGARTALAESLRQKPIQQSNPVNTNQVLNKNFADLSGSVRKKLTATYPWSRMVDDVYQPLFRRAFTLAELQAGIEFYKSPTGRKLVSQSPQLFGDGLRIMGETYRASIQSEMSPLAQDFIRNVRGELKN